LMNRFELDQLRVLDLFSGTGNISLEFASRGAVEIIAVDRDNQSIRFLKKFAEDHQMKQIRTIRSDVFKFLEMETDTFDLIFADPPYDLPQMNQIAPKILKRNLL